MIIKLPISGAQGEGERHIALMFFGRTSGEWIAIGAEHEHAIDAAHEHAIDAARACHSALVPHWRAIEQASQVLRALSEHPQVQNFIADGINGPMITRAAVRLAALIEEQDANLTRLLDAPEPGDLIRVGGELYTINSETGRLEIADEDDDEPEEGQLDDPDDMLAHVLTETIRQLHANGLLVSADGIADAAQRARTLRDDLARVSLTPDAGNGEQGGSDD